MALFAETLRATSLLYATSLPYAFNLRKLQQSRPYLPFFTQNSHSKNQLLLIISELYLLKNVNFAAVIIIEFAYEDFIRH